MIMSHGGARPNSGRKVGYKFKSTLQKEAARELVRTMITERMGELINSQIANATGIQHFFLRDPVNGQFKRITDPDEIEAALNAEEAAEGKTFWIFTKDPNVQAFTDLLNRALDKPAEQLKVSGSDGGPVVFKWQD